jgi:hypothetical protein
MRHAEGLVLVPSPVLGEIGYLFRPRVGPQAEVTFLRSSGGDGFKVAVIGGAESCPLPALPRRSPQPAQGDASQAAYHIAISQSWYLMGRLRWTRGGCRLLPVC